MYGMPKVRVVVDVFGREVREVEVDKGTRILDLLRGLGLISEEVVVALDGEIVPEDERIYSDCRLKIFSVVSGG